MFESRKLCDIVVNVHVIVQAHARKKMEAEEEIRRVRASAVKVSLGCTIVTILGRLYYNNG